eukprot:5242411-Amphidinium_carterae.1
MWKRLRAWTFREQEMEKRAKQQVSFIRVEQDSLLPRLYSRDIFCGRSQCFHAQSNGSEVKGALRACPLRVLIVTS